MKDSSNKPFYKQLEEAVQKFPNLRIVSTSESAFLKGIIDVKDDDGKGAGSFLIEIHCSDHFPDRFPVLKEVGDAIPCHEDFHKYKDMSCCVTVPAAEILQCKLGITVTSFIENQVIGFLANYLHRKLTGRYKNEYAHGAKGTIQFYEELFRSSDISIWPIYGDYAFGLKRVPCGRNDLCLCGSREKYKTCHQPIFTNLLRVGRNQFEMDLKTISK